MKRARAYRLSRRYCPRASSLVCARGGAGLACGLARGHAGRAVLYCLRCSHPRPHTLRNALQSAEQHVHSV